MEIGMSMSSRGKRRTGVNGSFRAPVAASNNDTGYQGTEYSPAPVDRSSIEENGEGDVILLARSLKEARFLTEFCHAVYSDLDPEKVCATAAAALHGLLRYKMAIFSFSSGTELTSVSYVPMRRHDGGVEILPLPLDNLHPKKPDRCRSVGMSGASGSDMVLGLGGHLGKLHLYQTEEGACHVSQEFLRDFSVCLAAALGKALDHSRLRDLSLRDGLTGLLNRRAFEEMLEIEAQRREAAPLSIFFIDIDDFKSINDRFGHQAGDQVIASVGKTIGKASRGADLAARYGGEEFVVLLPGATAANAFDVAERLRERIASLRFPLYGEELKVTASVGVSNRSKKRNCAVKDLLRCADEALYQAKRTGKNRVLIHDASVAGVAERKTTVKSERKRTMTGEPLTIFLTQDNPGHAELVLRTMENFPAVNKIIHPERGEGALDLDYLVAGDAILGHMTNHREMNR